MILRELTADITPLSISGNMDIDISGIAIDSRKVQKGYLFIAMKGTQVDGHQYIGKAIELGATAILAEEEPTTKTEGVTYIIVASTENVVGNVATMFYGKPSQEQTARQQSPHYYIICSARWDIRWDCCQQCATT